MAGSNGVVTPPLAAPGSEGVMITLDKPRRIVLTMGTLYNADRLYERLGGLPFDTSHRFDTFRLDLTVTTILVLLTCALQQDDPMLTFEQVSAMARFERIPEILEAVSTAWAQGMPAPAQTTEETANASPPDSTGSVSGVEPGTTSALMTGPSGA